MTKNQAINYVIKNARYHEDAPKTPYSVRFPTPHSSKFFCSADTSELVDDIFHYANLNSDGRTKCKDIDFSAYDVFEDEEDYEEGIYD